MRTTTAVLLLLVLALPSVARSHPCEAELAAMKKDLESIRRAVTSIEAVPPGDTRNQMLTGAKARYDLEQRRITEAQGKCDALIGAAAPSAPPEAPVVAVPPAPPPVPMPAAPAAPTMATTTAVVVAPAVETVTPVAPATVSAPPTPPAPCLTGCGKDTDCKGDRICVKGECVDPPAKRH